MRCALTLAFTLSLLAQESRFDAHSRLVVIPVTVTDTHGHLIQDLNPSDFEVLDNGLPQKAVVDMAATGVAPIALVIAVQSSGISAPVIEKVQKIGSLIQPLITGERGCAAALSFAAELMWLQNCTSDSDSLNRALHRIEPAGATKARMLDAVEAAVESLRAIPNARRILLLVSESRDRGSDTDLKRATAAAQSAGVTVYAATYSAFATAFTTRSPLNPKPSPLPPPPVPDIYKTPNGLPPSKYNPRLAPLEDRADIGAGIAEIARLHNVDAAKALTSATGGMELPFTRQKALENAIEKLGIELHAQYVVSFTPGPSEPGYHRLDVRLTRRGEFHVRARQGYWPTQ